MRIPPGLTEADFTRAIEEIQQVVGADWVFTEDADVDLYRDAYSPLWEDEEEKIASAAIAPASAEEVQAVMRIANEYKIPMYPLSTGRNLGYGGSAPVYSGSVVLDLKRMNRIIEVNEDNAYALVEPGVSYFDLYNYIQERGLKLWIDCADPGWGSLVGNALDHGVGYTMNPYRDHFNAHCGMEVVMADGELVRTGMGALPGSETWQQYKWGYGPWVDGIFGQSNFGVVTKMGFWLMPEPEAYRSGTVSVQKFTDVDELVKVVGRLMNSGVMNCGSGIQAGLQFAINSNPELAAAYERGTEEDYKLLDDYAVENDVYSWSSPLKFYGPPGVIDAQWEYAKTQFEHIDGVRFTEGEYLTFPLTEEEIMSSQDENFLGIPSLSVFSLGARSGFNPQGSWGHLGFSPVIPMTGEAVIESNKVMNKVLQDMGASTVFNIPPQSYHPRTFVILVGFTIEHDVDANRRTREIYRELIRVAAEHGWGEYRTHTAFMDDCADAYSFNNHALRRLHETIKDAVDPNGIISAGRYGIWPKHLRDEREVGNNA